MSIFKKCKVIMLPTQKPAKIYLNKDNSLSCYKVPQTMVSNLGGQHLYIISDDEIKVGDWFMSKFNSYPLQNKKERYAEYPSDLTDYKKVIATTDESLKIMMTNPAAWDAGIKEMKLPQPSEQFIKQYVEAYNNGKPIEEVEVEYELKEKVFKGVFEYLKVNSDNTINIKLVKDTWTREEVEKYTFHFNKWRKEVGDLGMDELAIIVKWIEENL